LRLSRCDRFLDAHPGQDRRDWSVK
jgi:hypothetical protein